jgi:tetratricopeptide (TPR) repeat protein
MAEMRISLLCLTLFLTGYPVIAQNNQDALWNYNTGRNLENLNRMDEAEYFYNEAVWLSRQEIFSNMANRNSYVALTWALQRLRRYAEVITWGQRGLDLYADEYRLVETMGEAYFYLNDHDASLRFMQRYTNSVPRGERAPVAYFFIGEIYRFKGHFRHADIAYTTAVRLEPNVDLWWYRLGSVREAVGDYSQAITAYERALAINPNYTAASSGLERSRLNAGL